MLVSGFERETLWCWMKGIRTFEILECTQWTCGFVSMNQVHFSAGRVTGQTAVDKFVRLAALCRGVEAEILQFREVEGTEMNVVEERRRRNDR